MDLYRLTIHEALDLLKNKEISSEALTAAVFDRIKEVDDRVCAYLTLSQGYLENANVQAVVEMVDMITTQRAYEMNSKVIQTGDQMLQRLTQLR